MSTGLFSHHSVADISAHVYRLPGSGRQTAAASPLLDGAVLTVLPAIQALGAQGPVFFVAVL